MEIKKVLVMLLFCSLFIGNVLPMNAKGNFNEVRHKIKRISDLYFYQSNGFKLDSELEAEIYSTYNYLIKSFSTKFLRRCLVNYITTEELIYPDAYYLFFKFLINPTDKYDDTELNLIFYMVCYRLILFNLPSVNLSPKKISNPIKENLGYDDLYEDINKKTTLLHLAAILGNPHLVKSLLRSGADPNKIDCNDYLPWYYAIENNRKKIEWLLLPSTGHVDDLIDDNGRTLLHRACMQENIFAVKELLKGGASVKKTTSDFHDEDDSFQDTALHLAAENANKAIVQLLINYGANVNALNKRFETPIDIAIEMKENDGVNMQPVINLLEKYSSTVPMELEEI